MGEFILRQGAGQKLEFAVNRNGCGAVEIEWLSEGGNIKSVSLLARGEAKLVLKQKPVIAGKVPIDPIVRIDRSIRPVYPEWVQAGATDAPEFIALERMGPPEFDASRLRKWWHPKQKRGMVMGTVIHELLVKEKILPSCLGLPEFLEIKAKGIDFLRQYFKGQTVFGWRSVVPDRHGGLRVPCLFGLGGEVLLLWNWLDDDWDASFPALRFAPQSSATGQTR
ncbi:MAG: hypothetical protein AAB699_02250 [Patescibacteria group bacterium]